MKLVKLTLLSATVLAGTASMAQAQVVLPASTLHGVGATSIENILVQELNCEGGIQNNLGTNAPSQITEPVPTYSGSPSHACSATGAAAIQPNLQAYYIATGSGGGRSGWEGFNRGSKVPTGKNPFDIPGTDPTWNHYQFAFTDGPLGQSDVTAYHTTQAAQVTAGNVIGNPIQIPMYVLPVALAYPASYGLNGSTPLLFNNKYPSKVGTTVVGGLHLTQANYCGIFNGTITNWNDPALKASNGGLSLMDPHDPRLAAGWASEGVPIRLVGRSESSGTTTIFTRHLAAVCGTTVVNGGTNKFEQSGNGLPWLSSGPDLKATGVDTSSIYTSASGAPSPTNPNFGNINNIAGYESISGAFYNKSSSTIVTTAGSETPGLFMVSEGSDGVAQAINDTASNRVSAVDSSVTLNGKFGYVSADFIAPVTGQTLYSAALAEIGAPTKFLMPSSKNAAAALTELPPQTIATNGAYSTADTRQVLNPTTNALENLDRANPLHWTAVLYPYSSTATVQGLTGLAVPTTGYAITGTTQLVTYTCFANDADRTAVANLIGLLTGKATKQQVAINAGVFSSTSATAPGLTTLLGAAPMPASWNTAIEETFLTKATTNSGGSILGQLTVAFDSTRGSYYTTAGTGGSGLQISSAIPTTTAGLSKDLRNTSCTAGQGA